MLSAEISCFYQEIHANCISSSMYTLIPCFYSSGQRTHVFEPHFGHLIYARSYAFDSVSFPFFISTGAFQRTSAPNSLCHFMVKLLPQSLHRKVRLESLQVRISASTYGGIRKSKKKTSSHFLVVASNNMHTPIKKIARKSWNLQRPRKKDKEIKNEQPIKIVTKKSVNMVFSP